MLIHSFTFWLAVKTVILCNDHQRSAFHMYPKTLMLDFSQSSLNWYMWNFVWLQPPLTLELYPCIALCVTLTRLESLSGSQDAHPGKTSRFTISCMQYIPLISSRLNIAGMWLPTKELLAYLFYSPVFFIQVEVIGILWNLVENLKVSCFPRLRNPVHSLTLCTVQFWPGNEDYKHVYLMFDLYSRSAD